MLYSFLLASTLSLFGALSVAAPLPSPDSSPEYKDQPKFGLQVEVEKGSAGKFKGDIKAFDKHYVIQKEEHPGGNRDLVLAPAGKKEKLFFLYKQTDKNHNTLMYSDPVIDNFVFGGYVTCAPHKNEKSKMEYLIVLQSDGDASAVKVETRLGEIGFKDSYLTMDVPEKLEGAIPGAKDFKWMVCKDSAAKNEPKGYTLLWGKITRDNEEDCIGVKLKKVT